MVIKKSKSVRELVYEEFKNLIINNEISPGEKIIETEYAKKFQISRTPIREAIRMLELEGYVKSHDKGGVTVSIISRDDIDEIYRIRISLESIVLEDVMRKITDSEIRDFENLLEVTTTSLQDRNHEDDVFELFSTFNEKLYSIAKLGKVQEMLTGINLYLKRFRIISIGSHLRKEISHQAHSDLIDAIKSNDIVSALQINKMHLERSKNFIKDKFQ